jgi:uncharacterized protein
MAYVEGQTIHDADSHVMELPGTIDAYLEPRFRDSFRAKTQEAKYVTDWAQKARDLHDDPDFRAGDEANLLLRKNYQALGAFRNHDRPKALDLLGFASQLVFTTAALGNYGLEEAGEVDLAVEAARAHNRMMSDYCSVDRRLLATGYVPLVDQGLRHCARSHRHGLQGSDYSLALPPGSFPQPCGP